MANDEEREFRLRPRKPAARSEHAVWASAYKTIMHYARMTSRHRRSAGKGCYRSRPYFQRCAVRVIYTKIGLPASGEHMGGIWCARVSRLTVAPRDSDSTRRVSQWGSLNGFKCGNGRGMSVFGSSSSRPSLATGPI